MKKLFVSDMTLCALEENISFRQKLNMAKLLEKAGVDDIALPPVSGSREDAVVCRTIASAICCGVSMACDSEKAIDEAYACLKDGKSPRLLVKLPVSTVQMEYLYHMKAPKMLERVASLCAYAKNFGCEVEFIAQDASRADKEFLCRCCETAGENGASCVTLCDDSGICFPEELAALVTLVKSRCGCKVFVQPSNALSLAAACAVAAVEAGADGVKTAAGKDLLSAGVLAQVLRAKGEQLGAESALDVTAISATLAGLEAPASAPAAPQSQVELDSACSLADIAAAAASLGYELSDEDVGRVFEEFRRVTQRKNAIGSAELEAIIATSAMQVPSTFHLVNYVVNSGNIITATANITLQKGGETLSGVSTGDGPIDAAFHAIESIIGHHYELDDFQIGAVTKGREAMGSSLIRLRSGGKLYSGTGVSTDIIGACIRGYINALNKIVYEEK